MTANRPARVPRRRAYDVAVVGLGPAGRALAHRLAAFGARVLAFDPAIARPWDHTLAGWQWQLPAWLHPGTSGRTLVGPSIRTPDARALRDTYVIFDNDRLQRELALDDVDVRDAALTDADIVALRDQADVVVDARGMRPSGHTHLSAYQTAFGIKVSPDVAAPLLRGEAAVLMDWTPPAALMWGRQRPSFLYAIPLPGGDVLLEETCLAGRPALGVPELRHRLATRLQRAGVDAASWAHAPVELVRIPLERRGATLPGVLRFGAAGSQSNPISGYSVAASLSRCDDVVRALAQGRRPRATTDVPARAALEALLRLDAATTVALFDGFALLTREQQRTVLDPHAGAYATLAAMARQAGHLRGTDFAALAFATARGLRGLRAPTWHA